MQLRDNRFIAACLSLVLGGLGQIYLREYQKALFFLALEVITGLGMFLIHLELGVLLNVSVSVTSAVDAFRVAKKRSGI